MHKMHPILVIIVVVATSYSHIVSGESCSKLVTASTTIDEHNIPSVVSALTNVQHHPLTHSSPNKSDTKSKLESFQCPRLFERKNLKWCCDGNTPDGHCCKWQDRAKQMKWRDYEGAIFASIVSLGVIIVFAFFCFLVFHLYQQTMSNDGYTRGTCPSQERPYRRTLRNGDHDDVHVSMIEGNSELPPTYDQLFPETTNSEIVKHEPLLDSREVASIATARSALKMTTKTINNNNESETELLTRTKSSSTLNLVSETKATLSEQSATA